MKDNRLIITLFGATGDLAARKLYPAIYRLYKNNYISKHFALIGTARRKWSNEYLREIVYRSIQNEIEDIEDAEEFVSHFYYQSHDVQHADNYHTLKQLANNLDNKYNIGDNRIYYISLSPQLFPIITNNLKKSGLLTSTGYNRLIIEKPFGYDLESAEQLQAQLVDSFEENQIFRIDHYLGKGIISTLPYLRFNNIFEHLWNKDYIDNIQITLAEDIGVEYRGAYYETSGATRDMIQNHVLQILAILAMPRPKDTTDVAFREAKNTVLKNIRLHTSTDDLEASVIRGQYGPSQDGFMLGYRQEDNIDERSNTETYFAAKILVDMPEWQAVPFFVRSGKRMESKCTTINVVFKAENGERSENRLLIEIQPETGYKLFIQQKKPGYGNELEMIPLSYIFSEEEIEKMPLDYERLILDVILGNVSNFSHWNEVKNAWRYIDNVHDLWAQLPVPSFPNYPANTRGPIEADQLLEKHNTTWY